MELIRSMLDTCSIQLEGCQLGFARSRANALCLSIALSSYAFSCFLTSINCTDTSFSPTKMPLPLYTLSLNIFNIPLLASTSG